MLLIIILLNIKRRKVLNGLLRAYARNVEEKEVIRIGNIVRGVEKYLEKSWKEVKTKMLNENEEIDFWLGGSSDDTTEEWLMPWQSV